MTSVRARDLAVFVAVLGMTLGAAAAPPPKDLVRAALSGISPGGLPPIDRAPHIALGLLAHFYSSSAAHDLCYRARIGKETCRPLAEAPRRPLPLAPRS